MPLSGIWHKYHMQYLKNLAKFHSLRGSSNRWITFFKALSRHFLAKYHNELIMLLVTQKRRFTFHKCLWNHQVSLYSLVCTVKCFPDNGSRVVSPRESLIKATAKHTPTVRCPCTIGVWLLVAGAVECTSLCFANYFDLHMKSLITPQNNFPTLITTQPSRLQEVDFKIFSRKRNEVFS